MSLHGAIDDATNTVLALHFRPRRICTATPSSSSSCSRSMACRSPSMAIASTSSSAMTRLEPRRTTARGPGPTHLGRILHDLGIGYIAAGSPEAKGRVERLWRTLQDRLTSELRLRHITTPRPPTPFCPSSWRTSIGALPGPRRRRPPPGAAPRAISPSCSAVAIRARSPATTRSTSGPAGSSSRPAPTSAPTPAVASRSGNCSMAASSSCMGGPSSPRSRRLLTSPSSPTAPRVPTGVTRATAWTCARAAFTRARGPAHGSGSTRRLETRSTPSPNPRSARPAARHPWRKAIT